MESKFKRNFYPSLALVIICVVVTALLSFTYSVTNEKIYANQEKAMKEAEKQVLPKGNGIVEKITVKSYGGDMLTMVGIDNNGKVTGVKIISHNDTPGLGTKAHEPEYLKQYKGISKLKADKIQDDSQVDAVTGATISSNAVYNAVKKALAKAYEKGGGSNGEQ